MEHEFSIEVVRPPGVGGQQVGSPNYPVRVTHLPTGIMAECGFHRSQHKNRALAFEMIEFALIELELPYRKPV